MKINAKEFFGGNELFDCLCLRPLSHINGNWDISWDSDVEEYSSEEKSYADQVNFLLAEIGEVVPPKKYHDNEDCLAFYVIEALGWDLNKKGNRWVGADYRHILEQGGFRDIDQKNLALAAAGRVKAAVDRGQKSFDDMEVSHQNMLAAVISIILYHRS